MGFMCKCVECTEEFRSFFVAEANDASDHAAVIRVETTHESLAARCEGRNPNSTVGGRPCSGEESGTDEPING